MASAGPYASLQLATDRQPCQHPTTQFFTGRMPFLSPNQQHQSTEGCHYCLVNCEARIMYPTVGQQTVLPSGLENIRANLLFKDELKESLCSL